MYTSQTEQAVALSGVSDPVNIVELCISASLEWLDDVRNGYKEDAIFSRVVHYLSEPSEKDNKKNTDTKQRQRIKERAKAYTLEEGLLFHTPSGGKLCIPKSLRSDVIREAHDTILEAGHMGTAKTAAAVGS